jgi:methionine biosynthesis protein MetW
VRTPDVNRPGDPLGVSTRHEEGFWNVPERLRLRGITRVLSERRFQRMIDVGCGFGEFTSGVAHELSIPEVYGVDFSADAVGSVSRRGIVASRVDLNRDPLPFPDETFDLAIMVESIEHLEDVEHCLEEVARVLRKGGSLVVTTPNLASWHGRLSLLLGFQPFTLDVGFERHYGSLASFSGRSSGHIRGFTLPALSEILRHFGFSVDKIDSAPLPIPGDFRGKSLLCQVDRIISTAAPLASDLIVGSTRTFPHVRGGKRIEGKIDPPHRAAGPKG